MDCGHAVQLAYQDLTAGPPPDPMRQLGDLLKPASRTAAVRSADAHARVPATVKSVQDIVNDLVNVLGAPAPAPPEARTPPLPAPLPGSRLPARGSRLAAPGCSLRRWARTIVPGDSTSVEFNAS